MNKQWPSSPRTHTSVSSIFIVWMCSLFYNTPHTSPASHRHHPPVNNFLDGATIRQNVVNGVSVFHQELDVKAITQHSCKSRHALQLWKQVHQVGRQATHKLPRVVLSQKSSKLEKRMKNDMQKIKIKFKNAVFIVNWSKEESQGFIERNWFFGFL